ncbi:MAG: hypothetical protein WC445_04340 [Patescibacteria group bacterium]
MESGRARFCRGYPEGAPSPFEGEGGREEEARSEAWLQGRDDGRAPRPFPAERVVRQPPSQGEAGGLARKRDKNN